MVSRKNRLNELRSQVSRLESNTKRKIGRNLSKGIIIDGSPVDPRRDSGKVSRYTVKQLESYAKDLQTFNSRATQFEKGVRGAPLPRSEWKRYKQGEQALVNRAESKMKPVADVKLPGPGDETISQRAHKIRTKHPTVSNQGYIPPSRQPFNVKDLDSLSKLTKANSKRMTKKWQAMESKRAKREMDQMISVFNSKELNEAIHGNGVKGKGGIKGLTSGQFNILWDFTSFADNLSTGYNAIHAKQSAKQPVPQTVIADQIAEAMTLIDWVKKLKI